MGANGNRFFRMFQVFDVFCLFFRRERNRRLAAQHDRVRFYLFALAGDASAQTIHLHGLVARERGVLRDVFVLAPRSTPRVVDAEPFSVGEWRLECSGRALLGAATSFVVAPAAAAVAARYADPRQRAIDGSNIAIYHRWGASGRPLWRKQAMPSDLAPTRAVANAPALPSPLDVAALMRSLPSQMTSREPPTRCKRLSGSEDCLLY